MKVIVCPLDWGIGHATRCVPVIRRFLTAGMEVLIAADGRPAEFLKREFPGCRFLRFPGYSIRYQEKGSMTWQIIKQVPKMLKGILKEHRELKRIIREEKPDIILSDNRYGLWNRSVHCIIMTHQLDIQAPGKLSPVRALLRKIINHILYRYNECWIPDFELNGGLAGKLSHPPVIPGNAFYIGILSRFPVEKTGSVTGTPLRFDVMAILSGPEPQRSILESIILRELTKYNLRSVLISGKTEIGEARSLSENIIQYSHLSTVAMEKLISQSGIIICRPGYSSIMDLVSLGKKAILIPTPGQTEQEYLAKMLLEKKIFFSTGQKNFDLMFALEMSVNYHGMFLRNNYQSLDERIAALQNVKKVPRSF